MNIDNNTAKLLMSQVLKDQLDVSEDDATVGQAHPELLIEIFIEAKKQKFSISGLLTSLTKDVNVIEIQNRVNVTDAHEIFSLLDDNVDAICPSYALSLFSKTFNADGPFKVTLKGINNISYKTDQCTICFELVRLKR